MKTIRYTLLSDGSSDRMLMPILDWLLCQHCPEHAVESDWADLGRLPQPPKTLSDKIRLTLDLYPCDLLFIHRDAEKVPFETRHTEITRALDGLETPSTICVIPVRMQEAWLLFDEPAIRRASGNPNGRNNLNLPDTRSVESIPDPKELLFHIIRESSGRHGTRLKKLNPRKCAFRVSELIDDFSPLRSINAFQALENQLKNALTANGWKTRQ
ncbi:MAG: hypothetical protein A2X83_12675 [Desulfuromonadales bacterium GWD2_54_10]|nr:MAG: hypothetical protein A2X83_12675 [Desulfuromonadales bacterium GWD2_54_10]